VRGHWGIENSLHYVRDVTCREDQARAHAGNAPHALTAFRNTTLTLIRRLGLKFVEGFEHFAEHRVQALELAQVGEPIDPAPTPRRKTIQALLQSSLRGGAPGSASPTFVRRSSA
jgi:hypothetical protein